MAGGDAMDGTNLTEAISSDHLWQLARKTIKIIAE
jgi:hypothetical protein